MKKKEEMLVVLWHSHELENNPSSFQGCKQLNQNENTCTWINELGMNLVYELFRQHKKHSRNASMPSGEIKNSHCICTNQISSTYNCFFYSTGVSWVERDVKFTRMRKLDENRQSLT
jgi:hypothetical protein